MEAHMIGIFLQQPNNNILFLQSILCRKQK